MWGLFAPRHGIDGGWHSGHAAKCASRLPRANALQDLLEIFPEDRQSMLKVAREHGNWREVLALHVQSVREMPVEERGESYCNTARALVAAQLWQNALLLLGDFREEASPAEFWREQSGDSIYQVLLSIYSRWGTWPDILQILEEAQVYPEAVTSADRSGAMRALAKLGSWQTALQVMADMSTCDKEMLSAGMNAWVSGHHWRKVFKLLRQMEREDLVPDQQVYDNAIASCFNVAMGDSKEAASAARATSMLLREMQQRELELTRRLWRMAIVANARAGDPEDAFRLLLEVREQEEPLAAGTPSAESSFNIFSRSCMRAFRRAGHWRNALLLLKEMPVDSNSFEEALKVCADGGQWQWTLELAEQMEEQNLVVQYRTYHQLISSFSNAQLWRPALWALDEAEGFQDASSQAAAARVERVLLYNKVITALVNEATWGKALWLLHDMPERQVQPNVITYGAVACVCNRARQYLYALQLHEDMMQKDINPDVSSFKTAVAACRGKMKMLLQAAPKKNKKRQKQI